jgi:DNA-directed RNA polymerase subunit RPC12/RpoP
MSNYIDRNILLEELNETQIEGDEYYKGLGRAKRVVCDQPTADVQQVKHGHWVLDDETDGWRCSECGHATNERILKWYQEINGDTCNICYQSAKPFYCSRCGAKMESVGG